MHTYHITRIFYKSECINISEKAMAIEPITGSMPFGLQSMLHMHDSRLISGIPGLETRNAPVVRDRAR
jgi:hypothetical protein